MKRLITVIFCLFSITTTYAQNIDFTKVKVEEEKKKKKVKHKIGLNFGTNSIGTASTLFNVAYGTSSFNFSYEYAIKNNFSATFNYVRNKADFDGYEFYTIHPVFFSSLLNYAEPQNNLFGLNYYLFGMKYSLGKKRVKLYLNPSIGTSSLSVGRRSLFKGVYLGLPEKENFEETKERGLVYGLSVGTDFRLSKLVSINLGYTVLNSKYDEVLGVSESVNEEIYFSTSSFSLGLNFQF